MAKTCEIEIFLVVDAAGDYEVATTLDGAEELFEENIGGSGLRKGICLKLTVPCAEPVEVSGVIPAGADSVAMKLVNA